MLTFSVSRHAHASWELIYCTSGNGVLYFDDFTMPYKEGDIAVIPPNIPHKNHSEDGFTNIHICIADPTLATRTPGLVTDDSNHFLRNAFEAAFFHYCTKAEQREILLSNYADLIVCYLIIFRYAPKRSEIVDQIEHHIIQNYPNYNYELDAYLQSLPFSYDYLRKLFKKELGVTPHQYLTDIRLQNAAKNLSLAVEERTVAEIARECGFREPLYFSRMFKKKYGVSPTQYHGADQSPNLDPDSTKIMLNDSAS